MLYTKKYYTFLVRKKAKENNTHGTFQKINRKRKIKFTLNGKLWDPCAFYPFQLNIGITYEFSGEGS